MRVPAAWIAAALCVVGGLCIVDACNEAVCASLVSKCILIDACSCEMSNKTDCSCCGSCNQCLHKLYTECCSCVGMCPRPDPEDSIFKTSSIEILMDPIPALFNVLTEEEDPQLRWTTHRYPVYFDIPSFSAKHDSIEEAHPGIVDMKMFGQAALRNCTVAFMSDCMSLRQCKLSCKSMGAAKYRWFNDAGCCQCIGDMCIDYGLNEPHCLNCNVEDDVADHEETNGTPEEMDEKKGKEKKEDRESAVVEELKEEERKIVDVKHSAAVDTGN